MLDVSVDLDPELCIYCGICEVLCPFNAIKLYINGKHLNPVVKKNCFPEIHRSVRIDAETCKRVNSLCERLCFEACPLNLLSFNGTCVHISDVGRCPTCKWCESVCRSVIQIDKIFEGSIEIFDEKCPAGCESCMHQCPVNALYINEQGKVDVLPDFCVYCGTCINFCPVEGAINLKITHVNAKPSESNTWKLAVEKLSAYKPANRPQRKLSSMANKHTSWPKSTRNNHEKELVIERSFYIKKFTLILNKDLCKKCRICYITCPKGAVNITRVQRS